ncbi:hypothetical protein [Chachezhania sediminis]|uniref:hypothetical protein n=1 Tax=Chachezhania sediminis TaxID=2599291 RepID=UPI00131B0D17|nr:hypothetical protein [Chachezhania sediminis]
MADSQYMTRRVLVKGLPMAAGGAVFPLAAETGAEKVPQCADPHPEWLARWRKARHEMDQLLRVDDMTDAAEEDALWARRIGIEDLLTGTPAGTIAGAWAQIQFLIEDGERHYLEDYQMKALQSVAATLGMA